MSNSRLFCVAWIGMMMATGVLKLLGMYAPMYQGLEDVILINISGLGMGGLAVAVAGDRDRRKA